MKIENIKGKLIVSCQALGKEPLNDVRVIKKLAYACVVGGAEVLRVSQYNHIKAIKKIVDVPLIGLIKKYYNNSEVFITPTFAEVKKLVKLKVEIIAMDATLRKRPKEDLTTLVKMIREKYPHQLLMADCDSIESIVNAEKLGFDLIATTLLGYTNTTDGNKISVEERYEFFKNIITKIKTPLIAEGGIWCPKEAVKFKNLGAYAVVVGSAITRPHLIAKRFLDMFNNS